ncbi:MAG: endopeptidase La [Bacteroidaceae bacterium]|nr:endopeptidase La [Bacteroidaceae bacterium]
MTKMDVNREKSFSLIADIDGDGELNTIELEKELPVLPLRNMVLFPNVVVPVSVGRTSSLRVVKEANSTGDYIAVHCQIEPETDNPAYDDLHAVGVIAKVVRILEMPNQTVTAILQGVRRVHLDTISTTTPYLKGAVSLMDEELIEKEDKEFDVLVTSCKDATTKYINLSEDINQDSIFAIQNISNPNFLLNFVCTNLPFQKDEKIELLSITSLRDRAYRLLKNLHKEIQLEEIKASIQLRTREDLEQQQKEYFLQQQIKNIQNELGGNAQEQEIDEFRLKARKMKWDASVAEVFEKEVSKLERINSQSPDYNVQINYLQTMLNLPWGVYSKDSKNIKTAENTLNKDHYGLEKVKERILEHLAVLKLKKDMKSPIICLYGPPGVGKTSLGRSIASALNRKYVRMSLGGLHDEAEIRGHRKTYIGAMPGRIIKNLIKVGTSNPVFVLDEIDKISFQTAQGDPSSALLEVLDPEQNIAFHDNFLDIDFDLSNVMFIATANSLSTIPQPLLDRMELIPVSGYITEEKIEIARRHLVPKELLANGLSDYKIKFSKKALELIVESYTRESGVRGLEKKIGKLFRKIARQIATDSETEVLKTIQPSHVTALLGEHEYSRDSYQGNDYAGVVTGLAWTSVGGEILFIETSLSRGKGAKLTLTGNLGDVMKESAMLALEYIKSHAELLGLSNDLFENWNIHLHVPEGAIPKDGPSAGITMATALASALTQRRVRPNLAMTGEITLRGKVLPVGGIKEKILAAKRSGIKDIILCKENKKDINEIQPIYLEGLTFHYVADVKEVFKLALLEEKVKDAVDLTTIKE